MTNPDNLEVLARRRLSLVEQKESVEAAIAAVDAQILAALQVGDSVELDGQPVFRVQQRRTFDLALAREIVPAELIEAATVPTVDAKRLQELLPPAVRDACMKPGKVSVVKAGR